MKELLHEDIDRVLALLRSALGIESASVLERMGGMTNRTYLAETEQGQLVVRLPGEGTEAMIDRRDEMVSTQLACRLKIDAPLLYFGENGEKISRYIPEARTMSPEDMRMPENIRDAAEIFHKLHTCGEDTGVAFPIFSLAEQYEKIILGHHVALCENYPAVKIQIEALHRQTLEECGPGLVPCHNDPLCANWVRGSDGLHLVDWEYAGMNDPLWDLADVSIEAEYGEKEDAAFLTAYFGRSPAASEARRFLANKLYLDYLWTLWGLTRVPFEGKPMEDYALDRWRRLQRNLDLLK